MILKIKKISFINFMTLYKNKKGLRSFIRTVTSLRTN